MLCSSCGSRLNPILAVDIDGTLGDYYTAFPEFACRYLDIPHPGYPWEGMMEMEEWLRISKADYRAAKLAYRQGGNKRWLPAYPFAAEFVSQVRSLGIEVWVATARPWQRLDNIDPDTQEWLRRNGIEVDGLLYGDDKYEQLLKCVNIGRVLGVVDDLKEMLKTADNLGLYSFQVARPHNNHHHLRWHLRDDLHEGLLWVQRRLVKWMETQDAG